MRKATRLNAKKPIRKQAAASAQQPRNAPAGHLSRKIAQPQNVTSQQQSIKQPQNPTLVQRPWKIAPIQSVQSATSATRPSPNVALVRPMRKDAWTQPSPSASTQNPLMNDAAEKRQPKDDQKPLQGEVDVSPRDNSSKEFSSACYFNDGIRRVDYVLVWEEDLRPAPEIRDWLKLAASYRKKFEGNLLGAGVELEHETNTSSKKRIHYLKLFISWETMCYYAEYLGFRAPLMQVEKARSSDLDKKTKSLADLIEIALDQDVPNKPAQYYTCAFSASKLSKYVGSGNKDTFFRPTQRFEVAYEVLGTQVYGRKDLAEVGLDSMIRRGIYSSAFPPHEGSPKLQPGTPVQLLNSRQVLHKYWARWGRWYKCQPLEHVRDYFGEKVAFYYAFIGHYTAWLVPASLLGLAVFIYGCVTLRKNVIVHETCHSGNEFKMCPLCNDKESESCKYWYLSDMCGYILISYLFDNRGTLVYSVFASFWACGFLESWKRQTATLASQWDMVDYIEVQERARPEYTSKCSEYAEDPITGLMEPHFSYAKRLPRLLIGFLSLLFLMLLSVCCLVLMLIFRALITSAMFKNKLSRSAALSVANSTSASANFLLVLMLEYLCYYVAFGTTEWEMHRTQTEYENQVILKVCVFELFNYYLSISFTAFVKANLVGKPGEYNRLLGSRFMECLNGSCMFELTQYLAIIFIFNQMFSQLSEYIYPKLCSVVHRGSIGLSVEQRYSSKQWEADFALIPYEYGLFWEYLEAVMQFGFVTLFVPAFPLAPLFALINNLVEIRLDARKLVLATRRPRPERAQGIGIWFSMMRFIAYLATISNATLMAFTSEFLPTTVYSMLYDKGHEGYKNFTLSWAPQNTTSEPCRYNGGFAKHNEFYWKLMAARIIFTLSFQQIVFTLSSLMNWVIPDVPTQIDHRIQRQKYLARKSLIDRDTLGRRFKRVDFFT